MREAYIKQVYVNTYEGGENTVTYEEPEDKTNLLDSQEYFITKVYLDGSIDGYTYDAIHDYCDCSHFDNGTAIDDFSKLYDMESVIKNGIGYSDWSYESLAKELGLSGRQAFLYKMKAKSFTREELRQLERILQVKF
jgi:hypothetical protein